MRLVNQAQLMEAILFVDATRIDSAIVEIEPNVHDCKTFPVVTFRTTL